MADSVRMIDMVGTLRGLREFKRLDPEQRLFAHRLGAEASSHHLDEKHRDIQETEKLEEARLRDKEKHEHHGRNHDGTPDRHAPHDPPEPVPEQDEGHLLDLKA